MSSHKEASAVPYFPRNSAIHRPVASVLLCLCALLAARVGVAQDASTYYTVQHPGEFKINWGEFYRSADAMTAEVRKQLPHKLDLAYGKDVKQRLDLYFPL